MDQYKVTGMSCAACSARVEKAVKAVSGVTTCQVSLLTNSMGVEGTASPSDIIKAVTGAGYGASLKGAASSEEENTPSDQSLEDMETPILKRRFFASLFFLIVLMYISMGHMILGLPLPGFFTGNHVAMGLAQLLLSAIVMIINQKFFISGFRGLIHKAPNMDTLVALGSGASFVWSTFALFAMTGAQVSGGSASAAYWMNEFYFESAAMILALITVGKMLEARSKGKTTDALKSLMDLAPKTAVVVRNGTESVIPISQVKKGDVFIVRPGDSIPVDGVILEGASALDESALTGESIPVDKSEGDMVSAATINQNGFLRCEATRVGQDTTLSQIIKLVSDAATTKAPIAKLADQVSGVFVPIVISLSVLTTIIWLLLGKAFSWSLARGISVLVISCPCALGLATPVAIMVGNGLGARNGILFKTAVSLERAGRVEIAALDKTGTITKGEPRVTDIVPYKDTDEASLVRYAAALESRSEHPLAKAITAYAQADGFVPDSVTDFKALPGNGLSGSLNDKRLIGGSLSFIRSHCQVSAELEQQSNQLAMQGKTPVYFCCDGQLLGVIAIADVIKDDSRQAIAELKNMGIRVVMLTGDNAHTAQAIGEQAGVDEVIAGVKPDEKAAAIRRLQRQGMVAMIGDGINDAPALTAADIGIAIGAGTDVAIDAAGIVLMKSRLTDAAAAIRLSRSTLRNIRENLFWAFFYNIIGIPLAAGFWYPIFGLLLSPMFGAAAMSLSSFCVVSNALRLNLFKLYDAAKDKKIKPGKHKEEIPMEKTIKIEGMMCGHCEMTVKKALEKLEGVESAVVSHEAGTAIVSLSAPVNDAALKQAVEDKDFTVTDII